MAKKAKKQTARGRKQDRARVASGQKYEVSYEAKKTRKSASAVRRGSIRTRKPCVCAAKPSSIRSPH
jgi:hypothetical protein